MPDVIGDVIWSTPGQGSADSLPLGNGNLAANVWTEPSGDIVLYLAKNDAWDHFGRLIKLGRLRLRVAPSLTAAGKFEQKLSLADAAITVTNGDASIRLWLDAHGSRLVIEVNATTPVHVTASLDPWRTAAREIGDKEAHGACGLEGGPVKLIALPDQIDGSDPHAVIWFQRNETSIWSLTLDQQGLSDFKPRAKDPLLNRTFGGCMAATGWVKTSPSSLATPAAVTTATLIVTAHAAQTTTPGEWVEQVRAASTANAAQWPSELWRDHVQWWWEFWGRSHIRPRARAADWGQADMVGQQSAWQRYLVACCGRGLYPVKFNGGLFTADWGLKNEAFDADYRRWGGGYWFQNTRLIYWALLANGDYELMRPLFRMYRDMLPLAEHRTQAWYGHGGAFFPETLYFWGTHLPSNYGWDRTGKATGEIENRYIRRHWSGGLELVALMLETHAHTGDTALLTDELLPIARAVLDFYAQHYTNDAAGKLHVVPAQALETWWEAENPMPEIAGLHSVLPRLLALDSISSADAEAWRALASRLPPLPTGPRDGRKILLPAAKHEAVPSNSENPELYAVFPFKLFSLGQPDLDVAQWTFARRMFPDTGGWRQDAVQAALLGLTENATFYVAKNYNDPANFAATFKGFWGPNYDWVPDFDHGSVTQLALQTMLVQTVGEKIHLFPAWPADRWDVSFKLHVSGQTTLEGELKDGALVHLTVTPESRRKDVVVLLGMDKSAL